MDDTVLKIIFASVQAIVVGVGVWLLKTALGNRESVIEINKDVKELEAKVEELRSHQVTPEAMRESVREIVETAFEKREKANEQRRVERSKVYTLETKEVVVEQIERLGPKIARDVAREVLREMRSDTGKHKLPDLPDQRR